MKIFFALIAVLALFNLLSSPTWYEVTSVNGVPTLFECEKNLCVNKDLGMMYEGTVPDFNGGEYQTVHAVEGFGTTSECAVLKKGNVYDTEVLCEYKAGFLSFGAEIVDFGDIAHEFVSL